MTEDMDVFETDPAAPGAYNGSADAGSGLDGGPAVTDSFGPEQEYQPDDGEGEGEGGEMLSPEELGEALGAFHQSVDAFAERFQAELTSPEASEAYNRELDTLARYKAPGFDDVMWLTEAGNHPAVIRTGRALARHILQLENEIETLRAGSGNPEAAQSRRDLEEEWQDLRNKADYWTNPKLQRRSRQIAEALFGTDSVGPGAVRTAVGVNSHRDGV